MKFTLVLVAATALGLANAAPTKNALAARRHYARQVASSGNGSFVPTMNTAACQGYQATNVKNSSTGITADLALIGSPCNAYGVDIQNLTLEVTYQTTDRLKVKIYDTAKQQYQLPESLWGPQANDTLTSGSPNYTFTYTTNPFTFTVARASNGDILFDTRNQTLIFENQYIQLTSSLPQDANIYGLGEVVSPFRRNTTNTTQTDWAADIGDPIDQNEYGSHPFYVEQRLLNGTTPQAHGVFLLNSNGMDIVLANQTIQYRAIGGIFEYYFFTGDTVQKTVQQYTDLPGVGKPNLIPYWSLGLHQCRWGYANTTEVENVVQKYRDANIPLEVMWNDIDYLSFYRDFTNDENTFPKANFTAFVQGLHNRSQKYIPIIDAAIYHPNPENASDAYEVYTKGAEQKVFITNPDGSEYVGQVWPGYTVFPDFLAPNTQSWWTESFKNFSQNSLGGELFDGIWLDMNEPSSFCVGSCGSNNLSFNPVKTPFALGAPVTDYPEGYNGPPKNLSNTQSGYFVSLAETREPTRFESFNGKRMIQTKSSLGKRVLQSINNFGRMIYSGEAFARRDFIYVADNSSFNINDPPYMIHNVQGTLDQKTVAPNATHADGTTEYDVHNLFGYTEERATYNMLSEVRQGERPFIIARSTFPGSGKYTNHWLGDNYSKWQYMYLSIPGVLQFQLFGIPMTGPDTCGFNGNSDEELCARWAELSAFYPFYRNHNTFGADPQEFYVWATVAEAARRAIAVRYLLLPYIYTQMVQAHNDGTPVLRALWYESDFADDQQLYPVDKQFLVGPAVLVTPVLDQGNTTVSGYFPGDNTTWYDFYTHDSIAGQKGGNATMLQAPLEHINVHIRGGYVLSTQQPSYTTTESRQNPYGVVVALDKNGAASGSVYLDDGVSNTPNATSTVKYVAMNGTLSATRNGTYNVMPSLANVTVLGVASNVSMVTFNGKSVQSYTYNATNGELAITGLNATMNGNWNLKW